MKMTVQCELHETKKNHNAKPHSHRLIQFATMRRIVATSSPDAPMYVDLGMIALCRFAAMEIVPETVKADGPTETNMPGRRGSGGSFCVMRR